MSETDAVTTREKLEALWRVARYDPKLVLAIVGASLCAAVLEGVGVGFLLPIVETASGGPLDPDEGGQFMEAFVFAYETLGIPLTLGWLVAGVGLVMTVRYLTSFLVTWLRAILGTVYVRDLMCDVYEACLDARVRELDRRGSDDLLNAVITQTGYPESIILSVTNAIKQALLCLVYLGLALYIAPLLTVAAVAILGGIAVVVVTALRPAYETGDRIAEANRQLQGIAQDGIQGRRDVRLFSIRDELRDRFSEWADTYTDASITLRRNESILNNAYQLLSTIVVLGLIYVSVTVASLSIGALAVFLFAIFRLAPLVSSLNNTLYHVDGQLPHLVQLHRLVDELSEQEERGDGDEPVPERIDSLTVDGVSFGYVDGNAIEGVSFAVERGEFLAFVGQSGAGKSTVAALIARLYEPDVGEIQANGIPITRFSPSEWRSSVAVVQQDPYVFDESLRFNLSLGNRDATTAELDRACEVAGIDEFFDELPDGYETTLGDDGINLSGGQRQRVAIGRALLKDADLLILDEATSDLDATLEARVHSAIAANYPDTITLVIAHRLSAVTDADRIYVMEDGRIVNIGTHRRLLEDDETYADLVETQLAV